MRSVRPLLVLAALAGLGSSSALAITNGEDDRGRHPSVGAIIVDFDDIPYPDFHGYGEWCTATLIAPRVVVTAAHCTYDLQAVGYPDAVHDLYVSFHGDPVPRRKTWIPVTAIITHPEYVQAPSGEWQGVADPHDIAVLILAKAVSTTPSDVAPVGFLDALQPLLGGNGTNQGADLLTVGYGGQVTLNPPVTTYYDTRFLATMSYKGLHDAWLRTSQNVQHGDGGTCYGDSGGPVFWVDAAGHETLVAVTSWGDVPCLSMGFYYRVDLPSSADFLADVLDAVDAGQY